ncbi:hypothetical protein FSARC_8263 [Fusarium sarcochroum]|uniref:Fido domain-containing protein n=1 Tax=Fusarium sarcochroum TaxID=1208366 RepID=A0A8H4X7D1_9HYPO|nr:hypothetical protein FSARC_8263 [Fusarium sarcochroum]
MGDAHITLDMSEEGVFDEYVTERLGRMVYGSNMIEIAGGSLNTTLQLCRPIFRGAGISEEDVAKMDPDGVYRTCNVRCGSHVFMDESRVPFEMRDMIASLESDIQEATEKGEIDSVVLASKYCHRFVNIHPFGDGNGRMCRLILNTLLLKYGGDIVCIGQDEADRREYLRIAVNASAVGASQNQQDAIMENYRELALFTLRHARAWV